MLYVEALQNTATVLMVLGFILVLSGLIMSVDYPTRTSIWTLSVGGVVGLAGVTALIISFWTEVA